MEDKVEKIEIIKNKIATLRKKVAILEEEMFFRQDVKSKINALREEIFELENKVFVEKGPTYTNEVLDLYLEDDSNIGLYENYKIALAGTEIFIGSVRVCYENMRDNMLGNIGYGLYSDFRGNGYMIQALELLREPMLEKGLEKPIITVDPENNSSIRVIEKFGGKKLENDKWYDTYEVDLDDESHKSR